MGILQLTGTISVQVDEVDVEQICIEKPQATGGFPLYVQAVIAALANEDVRTLQTQLNKHGHALEYKNTIETMNGCYIFGEGATLSAKRWPLHVVFDIIKRKPSEATNG